MWYIWIFLFVGYCGIYLYNLIYTYKVLDGSCQLVVLGLVQQLAWTFSKWLGAVNTTRRLRTGCCRVNKGGFSQAKRCKNGHRNSGFSHKKWWFSIVVLVYQRVTKVTSHWEILRIQTPLVSGNCCHCSGILYAGEVFQHYRCCRTPSGCRLWMASKRRACPCRNNFTCGPPK